MISLINCWYIVLILSSVEGLYAPISCTDKVHMHHAILVHVGFIEIILLFNLEVKAD